MTDSNQACFAGITAPIFQEGLNGIGPVQRAKLDENSQSKSCRDYTFPWDLR